MGVSGATFLCRAQEVAENSGRQIMVKGHPEPFAVFNLQGRFFLTDDTCTHAMASLADGEIEGMEIFCPLHGGSFDIATGAAIARPCTMPLKTYKIVEVEGELHGYLDS